MSEHKAVDRDDGMPGGLCVDKDRRIEVEMVVMVCYGSLGGSRPVDGGLGAVGGQLVRGGRVGWVMGWVG